MEGGGHHSENPVVSFFVNLFNSVKLSLPNQGKNKNMDVTHATDPDDSNDAGVIDDDDIKSVTYPRKLNFEGFTVSAEDAEKDTNPFLLWQVYAIGGFFVLQWAWNRWKEHKAQKKEEDDDVPPTNHD